MNEAYCTSFGCFSNFHRDDWDNGWPGWPNGRPCPTTRRAPPLWQYTVPQSQANVDALCGPAGCALFRTAWTAPLMS